jgi:hypothetical protein
MTVRVLATCTILLLATCMCGPSPPTCTLSTVHVYMHPDGGSTCAAHLTCPADVSVNSYWWQCDCPTCTDDTCPTCICRLEMLGHVYKPVIHWAESRVSGATCPDPRVSHLNRYVLQRAVYRLLDAGTGESRGTPP